MRYVVGFCSQQMVEKYDRLVDLQAGALQTDSATLLDSGFFPAYRALQ